ncbi:MAG: 50S ribosomal protein L13 [Verrucomicrobiota bacterium]|nr:50S ribosomal protein L13 [Verrucomicrobiota bacterium]
MRTFSAKKEEVIRKWYVVDAKDVILGRLATKVADIIRGKNKAIFTPHVDTGDFVIVINAEKIRLTGKKENQKTYMSYSGFIGGHKSETVAKRRERHPELLVFNAVKGMVPHNTLGREIIKKLRVFKGSEHEHAAQNPEPLSI